MKAEVIRGSIACVVALTLGACAEESGTPRSQQSTAGTRAVNVAGTAAQPPVSGTGAFGGAGGTGGGNQQPVVAAGALPCDVQTVISNKCAACHGETPIGGAPMPLMTHADWHADHTVRGLKGGSVPLMGQTMKVYEISKIRINETAFPMPQAGQMEAQALSVLNAWLDSGAPAATLSNACTGDVGGAGGTGVAGAGVNLGGTGGTGGAGVAGAGIAGAGVAGTGTAGTGSAGTGTAGTGTAGAGTAGTGGAFDPNVDPCSLPNANDPLVAEPGETCYEFPVHAAGSTGPFAVPPNETYNQFYYDVPWPANTVVTRQGQRFDNEPVLHHWLTFDTNSLLPDGTVEANVGAGATTLGKDAELIGGWAVGGCAIRLGNGIGQVLPAPTGRKIMVQWHNYNTTGTTQMDGTAVQLCTMPSNMVTNIASISWLGTENINVPAGQTVDEWGTCFNTSGAPITVVAFIPHMHLIGINMKTELQRAGSSTWETIFDEPFQFDYQRWWPVSPGVVVQPNDALKATCTFNNTGFGTVGFGESTNTEMCYQFTISYPANALANGVLSLIGATNTCWQFGE